MEAKEIAQKARKEINARNSGRARKTLATPQNVPISPHKLRGETQNSRPTKSGVHTSPPICGVLSISRDDTRQSGPLAKRPLHRAVESEWPAAASDLIEANDTSEQSLGAVEKEIVNLGPRAGAENNRAER
jgi:hypothetical protein